MPIQPDNSELKEDRNLYQKSLAKMQEAKDLSRPSGKFYLAYFIQRLDFAVHYMEACDEYGTAAQH